MTRRKVLLLFCCFSKSLIILLKTEMIISHYRVCLNSTCSFQTLRGGKLGGGRGGRGRGGEEERWELKEDGEKADERQGQECVLIPERGEGRNGKVKRSMGEEE